VWNGYHPFVFPFKIHHWACSEIRSRVLRSATVPFFYDKKNGTVALRSTLERISEHAHCSYPPVMLLISFFIQCVFFKLCCLRLLNRVVVS